jgi:hypothetical protein
VAPVTGQPAGPYRASVDSDGVELGGVELDVVSVTTTGGVAVPAGDGVGLGDSTLLPVWALWAGTSLARSLLGCPQAVNDETTTVASAATSARDIDVRSFICSPVLTTCSAGTVRLSGDVMARHGM